VRIEGPDKEPLKSVSFKYAKEDATSWPPLFRDLADSIEQLRDACGGAGDATLVADFEEGGEASGVSFSPPDRVVRIPVEEIVDWDSFHAVSARVLGFPSYYGRNMDAWIDCLTFADDPDAQMIAPELIVGTGRVLTLDLGEISDFSIRCPDQFDALTDCTAFVNWRRIESGDSPVLALSYWKR
jgi:hypothetical protein